MARTPSTMIPLGTEAPSFTLKNVLNNKEVSLEDLKGSKGTFIAFICNHCPFVKHLHKGFVELYRNYKSSGISFIAISSNDVENYPEDAPHLMKELFHRLDLDYPYLYDESQDVAKAYDAVCTPDFFLFDEHLKCVYRGQFDDSRPDNGIPVTGSSIRAAFDALLKNESIPENQKPSLGCNIKWKS